MNIEQLLKKAKLRPGMYAGCLNLEPMFHFVRGFLFSNFSLDKADYVDKAFSNQFDEWVKLQLEKEHKIQLENNMNYFIYISQVYQDSEQRLNVFFKMSDIFFDKLHSEEHKL